MLAVLRNVFCFPVEKQRQSDKWQRKHPKVHVVTQEPSYQSFQASPANITQLK